MPHSPGRSPVLSSRRETLWLLIIMAAAVVLIFLFRSRETAPPPAAVPEVVMPASDMPQIPFTNVASTAGIAFVHRSGATSEKLLPETGGGGAAWFDYDRDQDPDLLLVNGRNWPWSENADQQAADALALYRNDGGEFTDVTSAVGLEAAYLGQGVAIGDIDGDGDDDVCATSLGGAHLYRNDDGRFVEVTSSVGLENESGDWLTSAGFFDYDRDGDLDLFICNYVRWSREVDLAATRRVSNKFHAYAHPGNFDGTNNYLFRNDGGRFTDVSASAGIHVTDPDTHSPLGKALAATFVDFDGDGWLDVLVANDTVRHFLFQNQRDGTFAEIGQQRGFSVNFAGATTSGMGIDTAWLHGGKARLAVAVGNFSNEMTELFVTDSGDAVFFSDEATATGIGGPSRDPLTFGLLFDDFDLDGAVDLVHANGHLEPDINKDEPSQHYAQPGQLFWNTGHGLSLVFAELPQADIGDLAKPVVGRGIASADIDGDGDLDLALTQVDGPPLLLRNDGRYTAHWLRCRLEGRAGNPHAIGAVVELHAAGVVHRRAVMPTRGYLSQSEPVLTFGLGKSDTVDQMTVTWPDGTRQQVVPGAVDRVITIRQQEENESVEGSGSVAALANRAKAELENGEYEAAIKLLQQALQGQPDSGPLRRNLARAYVLGGRAEDAATVLRQLSAEENASSPANAYLSGLAALRQLEYEQAAAHFGTAIERDPKEATLHFQLALALVSLGRTDEARQAFERTAELDPLHGGAHYQLAIIARKAGEQEAFANYMRDYQRIRTLRGTVDAAAMEECRYTKPEALPGNASTLSLESQIRFEVAEPTGPDGLLDVAVVDVAESGRYRLIGVSNTGRLLALEWDQEGRLNKIAESDFSLESFGDRAIVLIARTVDDRTWRLTQTDSAGDWPEIAIVGSNRSWLVHYQPDHGFTDLTARAGLVEARGDAARWADLDHDGDVDLCTLSADGLIAWRNNSDGTFVNATPQFGLEKLEPFRDVAAVDLDGTNLGVDLVLAGPEGAALARNQFAGEFELEPTTSASWPSAERVLADDFSNDGLPDLLFLSSSMATLFHAGVDQQPPAVLDLERIDAVTTIDVENDGWLDVVVAGGEDDVSRLLLLRNQGGQFVAQSATLTRLGATVRKMVDMDADGDGDTDLLVIDSEGQVVLVRNDAPTEYKQLKLVLRSFVGHPSSIGTRVQMRREGHLVSRWTNRELPLEIGMGPHTKADSIQSLWPNGVAKNEIDVTLSGEPMVISILEFVRTSSCPFLYAWADGQWEFVTDLLGTAPLNVAVARGVPMPPDPDEVVVLGPAERYAEGDTAARLRVTCELREVLYLNHIELLAIDHLPEVTLFSRDRAALTAVGGAQILAGREPIVARRALGSDGIDRTSALAAQDELLAPPGEVLPPPVVGFTRPVAIELDFGPLEDQANYLLALNGWFRFGSSSTNIAASQRGDLEVIWPRLEVLDKLGKWHLVDEHVGFPAGNTKTIVCDLTGKLPAGVQRLRLTTSFEVRWDHAALYKAVPVNEMMITSLSPSRAQLAWHGFAELRAPRPHFPPVPNLARTSDEPPWHTILPGWCTQYGNVLPLIAATDQMLAILNSGDGATFEFAVDKLEPPPAGLSRTLALFTRGWIKEEDPNSLNDRSVGPQPDQELSSDNTIEDWEFKYNTRWVGSRSGAAEQ